MINFLKRKSLITLLIASLIILFASNYIILNFGFEGVTQKIALENNRFFPKGYFIGFIWTILVIFQTLVFKILKSQTSSLLVLILILNCFLYPVYTLGFSVLSVIILGNLTTLIFSSFTAGLIYVESKILSILIALTSLWILFVTYLLINIHL
jgi:tryptophan-rich sensory protein